MAASYNEDESIDEDGLRKQVDFAIEKGAAAVCVPGFGTEFYKLSDPERYRVADVVLEHTAKRKPVIISTGSGSIFTTIQFSRYAESKGANCLMVQAPRNHSAYAERVDSLLYERRGGFGQHSHHDSRRRFHRNRHPA